MKKSNLVKSINSSLNPPVSVIVATYKRDISLKKALESLINQTYESVEIIVVDDNGEIEWNNRVENIIDKMSLLHSITYIRNETNRGSAETRNIGIRIATGKYITFLDDDDVYLPDKIKNQVKHMVEKNSDYSITDLHLYDEEDRLIEKRNREYIKKGDMHSLLRYHLMYHITGTDTLMFKKEYLLRIEGFPQINVGDEFYLMQKAIESGGTFSYLPICDVKAYVHEEIDGLSSGESKIKGENELYVHKKKYFDLFSSKEIRYIRMRHFAVLAYAKIRIKDYKTGVRYALCSFVSSPMACLKLIYNRK